MHTIFFAVYLLCQLQNFSFWRSIFPFLLLNGKVLAAIGMRLTHVSSQSLCLDESSLLADLAGKLSLSGLVFLQDFLRFFVLFLLLLWRRNCWLCFRVHLHKIAKISLSSYLKTLVALSWVHIVTRTLELRLGKVFVEWGSFFRKFSGALAICRPLASIWLIWLLSIWKVNLMRFFPLNGSTLGLDTHSPLHIITVWINTIGCWL